MLVMPAGSIPGGTGGDGDDWDVWLCGWIGGPQDGTRQLIDSALSPLSCQPDK